MASYVTKAYTFIKGRSAERLRSLINRELGRVYRKTGILYRIQGWSNDGEYHYAWYVADVEYQIKKEDFIGKETDVKEIVT